jgi:predicted kinase
MAGSRGPLIHLIVGSTGAGKTTYAKALAERLGAVHFSIDQWMAALYWPDASTPIDPAWAMARVERCYVLIWNIAEQAASRGTPAILDLGFSQRAVRANFASRAADAGLIVQLHFIDVPAADRWRRTQAREASPADEHRLPFAISREMFDYVETLFEPPDAEEMTALNGVRI